LTVDNLLQEEKIKKENERMFKHENSKFDRG